MSAPKNATTITWRRAMADELFRDGEYTQVYFDGTTTCRDNLVCRPILEERATALTEVLESIAQSMLHKDDELERLRAFAREVLERGDDLNVNQQTAIAEKHGITPESLKVQA